MVRLEVTILQIFHMREALPFSLIYASTLTESVSKISRYNSNSLNKRIYGYDVPVPCLSYDFQRQTVSLDGELAILLLFQLLSKQRLS